MTETTAPTLTATITRSSHPDFAYFASARWAGRQVATRGSREQVTEWTTRLATVAARHGITLHIEED
jgi:sugar phosphate isomerase/epimerase